MLLRYFFSLFFSCVSLLFPLQNCSATTSNYQRPKGLNDPIAIDWRDQNVITPVKNQVIRRVTYDPHVTIRNF